MQEDLIKEETPNFYELPLGPLPDSHREDWRKILLCFFRQEEGKAVILKYLISGGLTCSGLKLDFHSGPETKSGQGSESTES